MAAPTAVVVGAGWAGEGHTLAMRHCEVEVAALCGRDAAAVRAAAQRLGVPEAPTDWRAALRAVRPTIVCIATPAALRGEIVAEAVAGGAHILCDKPLALTGAEAGRLFHLVAAAGVRHAYASTYRYDASVAWLAELVRDGRIGRLVEIEGASRNADAPGLRIWSWWVNLGQGGGVLHNGLTHALGVLARICGVPPTRAVGETVLASVPAAVVAGLHDVRQIMHRRLTPQEASGLPVRHTEVERSYRALLTFGAGDRQVRASLTYDTRTPVNWPAGGLRLFGDAGTIVADDNGRGTYAVRLHRPGGRDAEDLPVPPRLLEHVSPAPEAFVQSRWNALARAFVADVRGEAHEPYPTFLDGWRYQVAIDAVRSGTGWTELPQ